MKGYSNYWIFPELGMVWSIPRKGTEGGWIGSPNERARGYWYVTLTNDDGKQKTFRLHRLIWMSVHGDIPQNMEINHLSEDKNINSISCLNLMTRKENSNFGTRNQRSAEKQSKPVGAYKDGVLVMVFPSTQEARRNGYNSGAISECCRNCFNREGNNVYKGYTWKYLS